MNLQSRAVGQTDLRVTDVSFGCASIGNLFREVSDADAQAVLQAAWDAGIRYFDTAPHYGRGLSESRLGAFLKDKPRDSFVVSTKVGRVLSPGAQQPEADGFINPLPNDVRYDYSGDGIDAALEGSRGRLGIDHIDIVYVHDIGSYTHGDANAAHMEAFLGSGYERLVRLKEQGKIRAFGLGVNENEICLDVMDHGPLDVILLAGRLTLLDRTGEAALVPACRDAGTSLILGGIFNSGILATGPVAGATYDYAPAPKEIMDRVTVLQTRAAAIGMPLASAALHFARRHPVAASVLLGTANAGTLERNIAALELPVSPGFSTFAET
jgi:D-threo-aldose 1-dehydrogenase